MKESLAALLLAALLTACGGEAEPESTQSCDDAAAACYQACATAACQAGCDAPRLWCLAGSATDLNIPSSACVEFSGPIKVRGEPHDGVSVWRGPVVVTLREGASVVDVLLAEDCSTLGAGEGSWGQSGPSCAVVDSPRYVPMDGSYLVEASYGTIPIACPCDVGGGENPVACPHGSHPTDAVVRAFPPGGPTAEAVYSFVLGPGECYEHVACVENAEPPRITRLEAEP